MIVLSLLCVLGSAGLLVAGLTKHSDPFVFGSLGAAGLAAALIAVSVARRRGEAATAPRQLPIALSGYHDAPHLVPAIERPPTPPTATHRFADPDRPLTEAGRPALKSEAPAAPPAPITPTPPVALRPPSAPAESDAGTDRPAGGEPAPAGMADRPDPPGEPAVEDTTATDALRVLDLSDEVQVIDERPRYHLAACTHVFGRTTIALPISAARAAGFTPCSLCRPDATIAAAARGERST